MLVASLYIRKEADRCEEKGRRKNGEREKQGGRKGRERGSVFIISSCETKGVRLSTNFEVYLALCERFTCVRVSSIFVDHAS